MLLTIHTFMAIITADNYMDETFLPLRSFSLTLHNVVSASTRSFVNTHFGIVNLSLSLFDVDTDAMLVLAVVLLAKS
jgi:hypothetical protein